MARPLTHDERIELEALIDRTSLAHVLEAVAVICFDKYQHIEETWQDSNTAKPWVHAASGINRLAQSHSGIQKVSR